MWWKPHSGLPLPIPKPTGPQSMGSPDPGGAASPGKALWESGGGEMTELTSGPLATSRGRAGVSSSFSLIPMWTHVPHQPLQETPRAWACRAVGPGVNLQTERGTYICSLQVSLFLLPVYPHNSGSHKCAEHLFGEAVLGPRLRASTLGSEYLGSNPRLICDIGHAI